MIPASMYLSSTIVFIDSAVDDIQTLLQGIPTNAEIIILDPTKDGVAQITDSIKHIAKPAHIHIISHGAPGCLYLGNTQLSLSTLNAYTDHLQVWATVLNQATATAEQSSILLYGCNVAAGDAGEEFVQRLYRMTGVNLAASRTRTGNTTLGGNWRLETTTGPVAEVIFPAETQANYKGILGTLTGGGATWDTWEQLGSSGGPTGTFNASDGFGIDHAYLDGKDAVDSGMLLFVNGQLLDAGSGEGGSGATVFQNGLGGVNVELRYAADQNRPVLRSLASFTNPDATAKTITVQWVTNVASDGATTIRGSSNSDTEFSVADRWVITDDDATTEDPALTHVLFGEGAPVLPDAVSQTVFDQNGTQGILATYSITIPAGETRSLLFFNGLNGTSADAVTAAAIYDDVISQRGSATGLLNGLTDEQLAQVVNWDFKGDLVLTPISGNTTEAGGTATFTVALKNKPTADVTVALASSDATEGTVSGPLTFTTENWNTPQTVTVTGVDDAIDDGDVAYSITTSVTSTDTLFNGLAAKTIAVVNTDNEVTSPGNLILTPLSGNTTEAGGTATFTIALSSQPTANVTVALTSSDTTEGTVSGPLTFTTANWNTPQTVTVKGVDDTIDDGNIAYTIEASATSADPLFAGITPKTIGLFNEDNDPIPTPSPAPTPNPSPSPTPTGKTLAGTRKPDTLTGTNFNDSLSGLGGNDKLLCGAGNDRAIGGAGNDKLRGEDGNDVLIGGKGNDVVFGGLGNDIFVIASKQGIDRFRDFVDGQDKIGLAGGLNFNKVDIVGQGNNTVIANGKDVLAIVRGVKASSFTAADFTTNF